MHCIEAKQLSRALPAAGQVCTEQHESLPVILALTAIVGIVLGIAIKSLIDCGLRTKQPEPKTVASAQDLDETEDISPRGQIELAQPRRSGQKGTREENASLMSTEESQLSSQRVEELENMLDLSKKKLELTEEKAEQLQVRIDELETKN